MCLSFLVSKMGTLMRMVISSQMELAYIRMLHVTKQHHVTSMFIFINKVNVVNALTGRQAINSSQWMEGQKGSSTMTAFVSTCQLPSFRSALGEHSTCQLSGWQWLQTWALSLLTLRARAVGCTSHSCHLRASLVSTAGCQSPEARGASICLVPSSSGRRCGQGTGWPSLPGGSQWQSMGNKTWGSSTGKGSDQPEEVIRALS